MVKAYTCKNFEQEEYNQNYVRENVLANHETLPIGEFAIGTNTAAYAMAKMCIRDRSCADRKSDDVFVFNRLCKNTLQI